jgi:hypothetical protein
VPAASLNGHHDIDAAELDDDLEPAHGFLVQAPQPDYDGDWDLDLTSRPCPDVIGAGYEVDARLWLGKFSRARETGRGQLRESRRGHFTNRKMLDQYCDSVLEGTGKRRREALREAWGEGEGSSDPFAFGATGIPSLVGSSSLTRQFLPLIPGPLTRQLYWQSYFEMSAKAFEAYNHDPVSWRGVQLIEQFALGSGLKAKVTKSTGEGKGQTHDVAQAAWDEFWRVNKMDDRLKKIRRDLSIMGEQFIRYFPQPGNPRGMLVRSLDPASIYDIVTDPEDFETVFFYHQQFQTPYQLYAPQSSRPQGGQVAPTGATLPGATTRYIIRQIDWREIDHYRVNVGSSERRGRSDLYPILGWIKRMRDYMTSRVVQADMHSRYGFDLEVDGNPKDLAAVQQKMFPGGRPPQPGSVFGHSGKVKLNALSFQQAATGLSGDATWEALINIVAVGLGVPKEYLGVTGRATRANALVATEPAAKRFGEAQEQLREILENIAKRFFERARITDAEIEFTFPSIASEERSAKLEDLGTAEANGWISKQTAATIAAKELDIENYDFDSEQELIAKEFSEPETEDDPDGEPNPITGKPKQKPKQGDGKIRRPVMIATKRQAAKLDVTKSPSVEDDPPGLLVPTNGEPVGPQGAIEGAPQAGPQPGAATRGGMPASANVATQAGAKAVKMAGKARESIELTPEALVMLMREARAPRRRPDDPEFKDAAAAFTKETAANLGQLVRDAV